MHRFSRGLTIAFSALVLIGSLIPTASQAAVAPVQQGGFTAPVVASVQPGPGALVGIAHPITVAFMTPVGDRAAAERGIHVRSSQPAPGHFTWVDNSTVMWAPDGYWPPHIRVELDVHGLTTDFEIGDAVVATGSLSEHTFTVTRNGEVQRIMAASFGKPKRPTPTGSFTALSKERTVKFDSRTIGIPLSDPDGYLINGQYGVRVTWSGVYVHSAPWSVDSQGYSNVSHGCINLAPENAAWYFDNVRIGDPIIIQS